MRALVLSVVMLMSAVASAQVQAQGLARPPPPGQPTGPSQPPPPAYNNGPGYNYDDWDVPTGFRRQGTLVVVEREALIERLARMEEQLSRALERAGRNNSRDGKDINDALHKTRDEMNALRADLNSAPDLRAFQRRTPQPPPRPVPVPAVQPISEGQLQQLLNAIAKESFGDGKLRVLDSAASSQYFLVPQVTKILQKFSFGEDKLKAVRILWPRVLDRDNGYQLYQSFSFQGEKDQLRQIIGK